MIVPLWERPLNPLKDPGMLWKRLTFKEIFDFAEGGPVETIETCMGTCFLSLVCIIIYQHCKEEADDAKKCGRLPADDFWTILGNLAQSMCSVFIMLAATLQLWESE